MNAQEAASLASEFLRRARRSHAALRLTDESLVAAIDAMPDAADGLAARLRLHRESVACLDRRASALIARAGSPDFAANPGVDREIADLEVAVQKLIGDATADEFARKVSHGEE